MERLIKAINWAAELHEKAPEIAKRRRKYSENYYIIHPLTVLYKYSRDAQSYGEVGAIVCVLHDTIEDCETCYDAVDVKFGKDVADGVIALTKVKYPGLNREENNAVYNKKLSESTLYIQEVKASDRICNLYDMRGADDGFKRLYIEETNELFAHLTKLAKYWEDEKNEAITFLEGTIGKKNDDSSRKEVEEAH